MPAGFKVFAASALWAATKWPHIMQGHQRVFHAPQTLPSLARIEAAMLESSANSGIIIRADGSTRATIPFILANLLSQSLSRAGFPLELSRKHRRVHLPYPLKVHYVDAPFALPTNHWRSSIIVAVIVRFNRNVSRPANSIETVATAKISTVTPVATITAAQAATPVSCRTYWPTISGKRSAHGTHIRQHQDQALAGAVNTTYAKPASRAYSNRQETVVHQQRQQRGDREQHGGRDGRNTQITDRLTTRPSSNAAIKAPTNVQMAMTTTTDPAPAMPNKPASSVLPTIFGARYR